jgi:hypothetical protein
VSRIPWRSTWPVALIWLATRGGLVWLLMDRERAVLGDVTYYRDSLALMGANGLDHTLVEYPVPGVALVAFPYAIVRMLGHLSWYSAVVSSLAFAADAAFIGMLVRARAWGRHDHAWRGITPAEWVWLLGVPALGATTYARFDLVPGILVGVAVLYAGHRPAFAGVMAACATSLKYWPAMVLPALAAPQRSRSLVLVAVAGAGSALALASLVVGGWSRLFSPFTWQGDRGLQIESIAGTLAMVAWALLKGPWHSAYTEHNAWEVFGPGVHVLEWACRIGALVVVAALGWLWWRAWRHLEHPRDEEVVDAVVWLVLAAVTGFVVTSKVFSPQYLLWALPAAAAGLAVVHNGETWRRLLWWSGLLVLAMAMTQVFFPLWYGPLLRHTGWSVASVALLALRNLTVLGLCVAAFRESWRVLHTAHLPTAPEVTA